MDKNPKMLFLQPLSYKETVQSWSRALINKYPVKDLASLDKAQWEFKECEIDIVNVVGKEAYQCILQEYECIIAKQLVDGLIETHRQAVSCFSSNDTKSSFMHISPPHHVQLLELVLSLCLFPY